MDDLRHNHSKVMNISVKSNSFIGNLSFQKSLKKTHSNNATQKRATTNQTERMQAIIERLIKKY